MKRTSVEIAADIKAIAPRLNANSLAQQIRQYGRQKVKERDERIKKLLFAANSMVKITSNEDYTETIEKAFDILKDETNIK